MTTSWSVWRCNRQTGWDPWAGWLTIRPRLRWRSRRCRRAAASGGPAGARGARRVPPVPACRRCRSAAARPRSAAAGAGSAAARPRSAAAGAAAAGAGAAAAGAGAAAAGGARRPAGSGVSARPRVAAGARRPVGSGGTTRPAGFVIGRAAKDSQAHEGHSGPSVESHRGLRGSAKPTRGLENLTYICRKVPRSITTRGLFLRGRSISPADPRRDDQEERPQHFCSSTADSRCALTSRSPQRRRRDR